MNDRTAALFPHDAPRPIQQDFISQIEEALQKGTNLVVHAPTGMGKTAASLTPALAYALEKDMTVFFLTSRHTQHRIAIETLKDIKKKAKFTFAVADIVGKKWMCAQPNVEALSSKQFHDYCKALRDDDACTYYKNVKTGSRVSQQANRALTILKEPLHTEETVRTAKSCQVCPYEIALLAAQQAHVIVADYYYLFNTSIRESFLSKIKKDLSKSIIIVDEAHNLPGRMRELLTERITSSVVERAIKEAQKLKREDEAVFLTELRDALSELAAEANPERYVPRQLLTALLEERGYDVDEMAALLEVTADTVREEEKQSSIGTVASFLEAWQNDATGYSRILRKGYGKYGPVISLSYRCLDPSLATAEAVKTAHSVLLMSGTLTPTRMYRDLLGLGEDAKEVSYGNPFPTANRLALIVPGVTTKYSRRSEEEYARIAKICSESAEEIPGNVIIFFPSYALRDAVHRHLDSSKDVIKELQDLSQEGKSEMLRRFSASHLKGSVLLAVIGGNFSEGIDLPGNLLTGVIVVGLPLQQPDLESKALIDYYDRKFAKGWDYGYVLPAFTKTLQSAGRCIRSETDRGVILFLDERYAWPSYYGCFPKDWQPKVSKEYVADIRNFYLDSTV